MFHLKQAGRVFLLGIYGAWLTFSRGKRVKDYSMALLEAGKDINKINTLLNRIELIPIRNNHFSQLYDYSPDSILFNQLNTIDIIKQTREYFPYTPIFLFADYMSELDLVKAYNIGFDGTLKANYSEERVYAIVTNTIQTYKRLLSANTQSPIDIQINTNRSEIIINGTGYFLTPTEMKIITLLKERSGQVISKEELSLSLWGNSNNRDFTLNTHIYNIKKKIPPLRTLIFTKKGLGYVLTLS